MVMALFCFTVARARAMFAELLVWFAEPARSCAPHFDGAHFSSMRLSDTGPFNVWAEAVVAKARRIAARTAERTMQCLMYISSFAGCEARRYRARRELPLRGGAGSAETFPPRRPEAGRRIGHG